MQFIEVLPLPPGAGINRLDHTAYNTDDAEGMRDISSAKAWKTPGKVEKGADGSQLVYRAGPGRQQGGVCRAAQPAEAIHAPEAVGRHIIHIGILVHSRAAEDAFYRDLLGFRPYWFGGMSEDRVDWVSQQTPDSRDWLEYMLNASTVRSPSTTWACSITSPSASLGGCLLQAAREWQSAGWRAQ